MLWKTFAKLKIIKKIIKEYKSNAKRKHKLGLDRRWENVVVVFAFAKIKSNKTSKKIRDKHSQNQILARTFLGIPILSSVALSSWLSRSHCNFIIGSSTCVCVGFPFFGVRVCAPQDKCLFKLSLLLARSFVLSISQWQDHGNATWQRPACRPLKLPSS